MNNNRKSTTVTSVKNPAAKAGRANAVQLNVLTNKYDVHVTLPDGGIASAGSYRLKSSALRAYDRAAADLLD